MLEGAEAVLEPCKFAGFSALKKVRLEKRYRPRELDERLRFARTRLEARLLHKAKEAGVLCPFVLAVGKDFLIIEKLDGKTLNKMRKIEQKSLYNAGGILAKLHSLDIVHGDYTPANLMLCEGKLFVIDFGLGIVSCEIEDKAVDLLTMCDAIGEEGEKVFLQGYAKYADSTAVKRMEEVRKRARYRERKEKAGD